MQEHTCDPVLFDEIEDYRQRVPSALTGGGAVREWIPVGSRHGRHKPSDRERVPHEDPALHDRFTWAAMRSFRAAVRQRPTYTEPLGWDDGPQREAIEALSASKRGVPPHGWTSYERDKKRSEA